MLICFSKRGVSNFSDQGELRAGDIFPEHFQNINLVMMSKLISLKEKSSERMTKGLKSNENGKNLSNLTTPPY